MKNELTIDIETIPSQKEGFKESISCVIAAPGNYKKPESIQKWMDENEAIERDKIYRATSFDGLHGEIICISVALGDGKPISFWRDVGGSEAVLLDELFEYLQDKRITTWIGHYITGFDLRFIFQRCVINDIAPSVTIPYSAAPWDSKVFDTCIEWAGLKKTGAGGLDAISRGLGYEGKEGMTGADVWDYWKAGRISEIVEYCEDDVKMARSIYKRMNFL